MASSTSLRTIWLTMRATNYTSHVFTSILSQMNGLIAKEAALNLAQISLGKSALSVGIMFGVLGGQIGGIGGQVLSLTGYFMIFGGALSMASGLIQSLSTVNWAHTASVLGMTISYKNLAIAVTAAFASFMIFYHLFQGMPTWATAIIAIVMALAAAFWALYVAETAATWGIAGIMGGAAAAAAVVTAQSYMGQSSSFATGTRMVGATGPAILHRGEVVYNPSTGRPTQVGNDLHGGMGGGVTTIDASLHVDTLNTKASEEQLNELLRKQGRKLANDQR
jgi:hypothetical protein